MISQSASSLAPAYATHFLGMLWGETIFDGKWVFVGALGLVLLWLIVMPRSLIGQTKSRPPWWRNVRFWAIVICLVQIWIYWRFA